MKLKEFLSSKRKDEELRGIIINTLSCLLCRISGKVITQKKLKELEDITDQVMEGRKKYNKKG